MFPVYFPSTMIFNKNIILSFNMIYIIHSSLRRILQMDKPYLCLCTWVNPDENFWKNKNIFICARIFLVYYWLYHSINLKNQLIPTGDLFQNKTKIISVYSIRILFSFISLDGNNVKMLNNFYFLINCFHINSTIICGKTSCQQQTIPLDTMETTLFIYRMLMNILPNTYPVTYATKSYIACRTNFYVRAILIEIQFTCIAEYTRQRKRWSIFFLLVRKRVALASQHCRRRSPFFLS